MPTDLIILGMSLLVIGAVYAALTWRRPPWCAWGSFIFVLAASATNATAGVMSLLGGGTGRQTPLFEVPGIGASFALKVDHLSAVFLIVLSLIAACTSLFAVRAMEKDTAGYLRFYPILLLFLASVFGVVCSWDMLFFLVFWEFMTLASYVLVVHDWENPVSLRAGLKYFIVTHVATAGLVAAAIITYAYGGHSFSFNALGVGLAAMSEQSPVLLHVVLGLFFIGFATKAGIFPFGDWLPDAYPAAPAPASAAFAGTMTKLGIYGLVRIFCQALPISDPCQTWGIVLASFGTASIALGTLTALVQDDSKRLLSFNLVGQLGYILLAVGLAAYFRPISPPLAVAALLAAIFHLVNDAFGKSCLFLNAGAIEDRAGARDLNLVGGLAAVMPVTVVAALAGSLSISGMPPFSGFSSKWLIYHASIIGGKISPFAVAFGIIAMFISIVTLAVFLKFMVTAFLGRLRAPVDTDEISEVPASMVVPQLVLAVFCVLFGVAPMIAARPIYQAVSGVLGRGYTPDFASIFGGGWAGLQLSTITGAEGAWVPWPVLIALFATGVIAYLIYRAGAADVKVSDVWYCGEEHGDVESAYRAHSFYRPFKDLLHIEIGSFETEGLWPKLPPLKAPSMEWLRRAADFDRWAYYPLIRVAERLVRGFSRIHVGIAQVYLLWMVVGVIAAIAVMLALGYP